jgi:hypothetical protein
LVNQAKRQQQKQAAPPAISNNLPQLVADFPFSQ